jgi:tagatose-1,6-bisphosphate aldolase
MKEAARAFVKTVIAGYTVWACEVVSEEEVDVETWVREHCPDWLKDDTEKEERT